MFCAIVASSLGRPDKVVGFARVGVSRERIASERRTIVATGVLVTGAVILLGLLTSLLLARGITRSVGALMQGVEAISRQRLDHLIAVDSKDEIRRFATTFNHMTATLRQRNE